MLFQFPKGVFSWVMILIVREKCPLMFQFPKSTNFFHLYKIDNTINKFFAIYAQYLYFLFFYFHDFS